MVTKNQSLDWHPGPTDPKTESLFPTLCSVGRGEDAPHSGQRHLVTTWFPSHIVLSQFPVTQVLSKWWDQRLIQDFLQVQAP